MQSAVIITGNTLGEGQQEQAQRQGITFTALGFVLGTVCGFIIVLISPLGVGLRSGSSFVSNLTM